MNNLKFWQDWHPTSRSVYLFLLTVFLLVIVAFVTFYPKGMLNMVAWERISTLQEVPVAQDPISVGLFSFSYDLNFSVVLETFVGSSVNHSSVGAYLLLGVVALGWIILLTIFSALDRFWYYVGVLILLGLILLLQLEQLLWFGQTQKFGVVLAFGLFLLPTAYFQLINPNARLSVRLLTFSSVTALFAGLIFLFAEVAYPFLTLAYHSLWVPIILSVLFIIIVGHELISLVVQLITQNNTPQSSNSLLHIFVLSAIYLLNLSLLVLKNIGTIDWDIIYIDTFWLLAILSIIGIWGFKQREVQYKFLFPFAPLGALFYLTLGTITLATVAFLSWQGNDPLLESLEDTIAYTQIGFSAIFLIYLIANFIQPLLKNQRVFTVLYRPINFPYGTVLIVGTIVTLAFFARGGFFSYSQLLSGYNIGIGDLHWMKEELFVAEQYYKLSDQYANNNHRANYSLGALARQQDDPVLNAYYFQEALQKKPSPLAYANSAAAYVGTNQYFDALFTLKEGVAAFPDNAYLENNLAMLYGRTKVLDSALYWLTNASENTETQAAAEANIVGLIGQQRTQLNISTDSIIADFVTVQDYAPTLINTLLLQEQSRSDSLNFLTEQALPTDSALNAFSFAQLKNYLLQASPVDTALLSTVQTLADLAENFPYTEELILAIAIAEYQQNKVVNALRKLDRLQSVNVFKRNYYLNIIGLWALEQSTPRVATRYFAQLADQGYQDARLKFAVSLTESLSAPDVALEVVQRAWQEVLSDSTQTTFHDMASQQLQILSVPIAQMETDTERYQWLRYRGQELTEEQIQLAFTLFEDQSYAAVAAYDLLQKDQKAYREMLAPVIQRLRENESSLNYQGTIYLEWAWALATITDTNVSDWKNRVDMLVPLTKQQQYQKAYWQALLAHSLGEEDKARERLASLLGNPFFEPGLIGALRYFYADQPEVIYQYFLDAIQTNPYSAVLLEEYILSAVRVGLENYAEESLADLEQLSSSRQYQQFMQRYQQVKDEQAVAF
ncbi:hypothetical protein [Tunicatimonas pelagia]|uniref:hypothetical protein n=1 Tax=Tunicatimonas pelagia TaxID=931531 RepID=UPI00266618AC|nr:hypothetical protein [Tunicatimonas pelagia]WKN42707.1 hypothetical protein P0M28_27090 [Tunicatimonas pelagia]